MDRIHKIYSIERKVLKRRLLLTDRLGAGKRTKHIDTRYFWIQERVQDGDLSIKKVLTAKICADVGTKPVSASVLKQHCKFAGLVFWMCYKRRELTIIGMSNSSKHFSDSWRGITKQERPTASAMPCKRF